MNITLGNHTDETNGLFTPNDVERIDAASLLEINCEGMLDYVKDRYATLNLLLSKLRHGGRILIKGHDIAQISRYITTGQLSTADGASMLYSGRQSTVTSKDMVDYVNKNQLKLIKVINEGVEYFVVAERP